MTDSHHDFYSECLRFDRGNGLHNYESARFSIAVQADITFGFFRFGARLIIRIVFFPV